MSITVLLLLQVRLQLFILRTSYLYLEIQCLVPLWVCVLLNDLSTQLVRQKKNTHQRFFCYTAKLYPACLHLTLQLKRRK